MTNEELRELDAWIAEKMMGWKCYSHKDQENSLNHGERFLTPPDYNEIWV